MENRLDELVKALTKQQRKLLLLQEEYTRITDRPWSGLSWWSQQDEDNLTAEINKELREVYPPERGVMRCTVHLEIDNSAYGFAGSERYRSGDAIAETLHSVARNLGDAVKRGDRGPVLDPNGNRVGEVAIY